MRGAGKIKRLIVRGARAALAAFFFLGYGAGSLLLGFFLLPILLAWGGSEAGRRRARAAVRQSYRLFVACAHATGLFRVSVSDEDRRYLAACRGAVVVSPHLTLIDIVILLSLLPDATAVAKATTLRNPFYARVIACLFLVNNDPLGILTQAAEGLQAGTNIVVFPEGTRTRPDAPVRRLHRGAAQIALHANARIVCLSLACSPPVLGKGQPWWDVGTRTIVYTLRAAGEIAPPERREAAVSRQAAIALTRRIYGKLWP